PFPAPAVDVPPVTLDELIPPGLVKRFLPQPSEQVHPRGGERVIRHGHHSPRVRPGRPIASDERPGQQSSAGLGLVVLQLLQPPIPNKAREDLATTASTDLSRWVNFRVVSANYSTTASTVRGSKPAAWVQRFLSPKLVVVRGFWRAGVYGCPVATM